jgi:hypothetical protein
MSEGSDDGELGGQQQERSGPWAECSSPENGRLRLAALAMVHDDVVTPQQLEVAVLAAIEQVRSGQLPEDDRMELKRSWPEPSKVRQLAGAANRANGDALIYIIGIDEQSGTLHPQSGVDPANWWAQISARFDQVPPELVRHLSVPIDEAGSVTALLFDTSRAPYVVKSENGGSPEREVPMREGTRTRSARREELLRMLIPETTTPPATVLSASFSGHWYAPKVEGTGSPSSPEQTSVHGRARVFLEHTSSSGILLPAHLMTARLRSDTSVYPVKLTTFSRAKSAPTPAAFSVSARHDGIAATGPGAFACRFELTLPGDHRKEFVPNKRWRLVMEFGVAGSSRPIRLDTPTFELRRTPYPISNENAESLPTWGFGIDLE